MKNSLLANLRIILFLENALSAKKDHDRENLTFRNLKFLILLY